ncbi:MAG: hypothetical protein C4583_08945 [Anaerolineaceae bacterium]|nr:MAG: hypothetical protein C4583_08945 [Anaerolineaceae bacterium]
MDKKMLLIILVSIGLMVSCSTSPVRKVVPADLGIRYGKPIFSPSISEEKAIGLAKSHMKKPAAEIVAEYVLFSNDQYYTVDSSGQKDYKFQDVPAWVITFKRVDWYSNGPIPRMFIADVNVVINAVTGEYMEMFVYGSE